MSAFFFVLMHDVNIVCVLMSASIVANQKTITVPSSMDEESEAIFMAVLIICP